MALHSQRRPTLLVQRPGGQRAPPAARPNPHCQERVLPASGCRPAASCRCPCCLPPLYQNRRRTHHHSVHKPREQEQGQVERRRAGCARRGGPLLRRGGLVPGSWGRCLGSVPPPLAEVGHPKQGWVRAALMIGQ